MSSSFTAKFKSPYGKDVLKNRHMITADDNVWQGYIKAHRDARQFMTRPIPYYKDLCVLCGDSGIEENDVAMDWFDPETELQEFNSSGTTDLYSSGEEEDSNSLLFEPKNKRYHQLGPTDTIPIKPKKPRVDETKTMGIEDAVESIQALPDMDEELILDACDLIDDEL